MRIGIIGLGIVGGAVHNAFKAKMPCVIYDPPKGYNDFKLILKSNVVFCCVPTLTKENGFQDLSILTEILSKLKRMRYEGIVVIKSTIVPDALNRPWKLRIVHNPEFLTERNPNEDFINQKSILLSGTVYDCYIVERLYKEILPYAQISSSRTYATTIMAKYIHNCFLATKVAFFNEMYEVALKIGVNFEDCVNFATLQNKILKNHTRVPGPDGKLGFGGSCFPKDTKAWSNYVKSLGLKCETVDAAIAGNKKRRK